MGFDGCWKGMLGRVWWWVGWGAKGAKGRRGEGEGKILRGRGDGR